MSKKNCSCTQETNVSKVKVEENGRKAVFINLERRQFTTSKMDNCIIVGKPSCDFLIHRHKDEQAVECCILVELKGKDVDHAIDQIEATMEFVQKAGTYPRKIAALIVCTGRAKHPSFESKLQRAKNKFLQKYKAPFHIVTGNYEYHVDNVISFKGPHSVA